MAYAMLAVVAVFSLMPVSGMGVSDKLLHFITYFTLSAVFTTLVRFNASLLRVAIGLVIFGVLLEFLQGQTGYRMMEVMDMLANSLGVVCGLLVRVTPLPAWSRMLEHKLFG